MKTNLRLAGALFIGLVIFLLLPLVSWGANDLRGFFEHPARLGYTLVVFLVQVSVVILIPSAAFSRGEGKRIVSRQRWAVVLLQVLSLAILWVAPYCDRRGLFVVKEAVFLRWAGLGLLTVGFIVMHWAVVCLDKQFSVQVTIQDNHQLVTHGPYRCLRHPRYLGIVVLFVGISLVYRSWLALLLAAAVAVVLWWRIYDEEALLHREFGVVWEAYAQKTWRFIPFVY